MQQKIEEYRLYFMANLTWMTNSLFEEKPWEKYKDGNPSSKSHSSLRRWRWPQAYISATNRITAEVSL